jgi:hypothetical protein
MNLPALHIFHPQDDAAVIQQQGIAAADVFRQLFVGNTDAFTITGVSSKLRIQHKGVAFFEHDLAILEFVNADLGALQIGDDADLAAVGPGPVAYCRGPPDVIFL